MKEDWEYKDQWGERRAEELQDKRRVLRWEEGLDMLIATER